MATPREAPQGLALVEMQLRRIMRLADKPQSSLMLDIQDAARLALSTLDGVKLREGEDDNPDTGA